MEFTYKINAPITTRQFISLLKRSTLGERRPIEDQKCIKGMITNSNLMITAWKEEVLVGIARSVTDCTGHPGYVRAFLGTRVPGIG